MDHLIAGDYWNANAEAWTKLARAGYDTYRDHLNTPAFLAMLPPVAGLEGLDIGCGEGHNTRLIALRGARMTGLDIAEVFIRHARAEEQRAPLGITYHHASAVELPYKDGSFDFAVGCMSLMDIPETARAVEEAFRVLRPGGWLQFSILHPCFNPPHRATAATSASSRMRWRSGTISTGRKGGSTSGFSGRLRSRCGRVCRCSRCRGFTGRWRRGSIC